MKFLQDYLYLWMWANVLNHVNIAYPRVLIYFGLSYLLVCHLKSYLEQQFVIVAYNNMQAVLIFQRGKKRGFSGTKRWKAQYIDNPAWRKVYLI